MYFKSSRARDSKFSEMKPIFGVICLLAVAVRIFYIECGENRVTPRLI